MIDTPDCKLVFVVRAACVRRVPLAVFNRQRVLDLMLFRPVEADPKDARVHDLIHALIKLEEDCIQVERRSDFAANLAEQLDRVFLRGNLRSLGTNLLGAFVDCGLERLGLGLKSFSLAKRFLALMETDQLPGQQALQYEKDQVNRVSEIRPVPRRNDCESIARFFAHAAVVRA